MQFNNKFPNPNTQKIYNKFPNQLSKKKLKINPLQIRIPPNAKQKNIGI